MLSSSRNYLIPLVILLGIALFNVGIMATFILNILPSSITAHLVTLAAIEAAVILRTYRSIKRDLMTDASL